MSLIEIACMLVGRTKPGRALSSAERRTLAALADVLLEGSPVTIPGPRVADNVDRFLTLGRSAHARRCRLLLIAIEHATLPFFGRRLSTLDKAEVRAFVVQRPVPARGPWWALAKVRYLVLMGAYGDARAAAPVGFVPVFRRARFRRASASTEIEVLA